MRLASLSVFLCAFVAFAQFPFPGQGPFPGGGGGPYPNGGPNPNGNPNPNGQGGGTRRGKQQKEDSKKGSDSKGTVSAATAEGIMRRANSNQLVIETGDHRIVWFRINGKTTTSKDGKDADAKEFQVGDHLMVDYTEDDDGIYFATAITWNATGTSAEKGMSNKTWDLPRSEMTTAEQSRKAPVTSGARGDDDRPILRRNKPDKQDSDTASAETKPATGKSASTPAAQTQTADDQPEDTRAATQVRPPDPAPDADDPGRPRLKRGEPIVVNPPKPPAPPVTAENLPGQQGRPLTVAPSASAIQIQEDPVIAKAREVALEFADRLPNFFCQQNTTRYRTENAKRGWDPIDIVTADVTYEDGSESYKNIKVGSKPAKSMGEVGGATSTGEFYTEVMALMNPASGATFKRNGNDTVAGHSALVYKFDVARESSGWRIESPSQLYYPEYRGTIWIDKESSRVLRIEQEGRDMPLGFVFDTVEASVDYEYVRLGSPEQYLLPVQAEMLSCVRGTSLCSRNRIEFRNYRKFDAASSIKFGATEQ